MKNKIKFLTIIVICMLGIQAYIVLNPHSGGNVWSETYQSLK